MRNRDENMMTPRGSVFFLCTVSSLMFTTFFGSEHLEIMVFVGALYVLSDHNMIVTHLLFP